MTIAVMQPYFMPYLGYFQLVGAVDTFVFFDDVNFIKKGWINRNNILNKDQPLQFSIPLSGASQNKKINELLLAEPEKWKSSFLSTIEHNYKKAPYYSRAFALLEELLNGRNKISDLAEEGIKAVIRYAGIEKKFLRSSELDYTGTNGEEKILSICQTLGANQYLNPVNGAHMYTTESFAAKNVKLAFLVPVKTEYPQFTEGVFVPWLSMIDVLMFNSPAAVKEMIGQGRVVNDAKEAHA